MIKKGPGLEEQNSKGGQPSPMAGMTVRQQIQFQLEQGKKRNPLNDIAGLWPGNETDEEFEEMLRSLD